MNRNREKIRISDVLRSGSVFRNVFFSVTLLSLVMILLVFFWINRFVTKTYRDERINADLNRLSAADRTLTQVCDDLTANLTQFLWNTDVLDFSLRPFSVSDSTYYAVSRQLKNEVNTNRVIKKAAYYCVTNGDVIQSATDRITTLDTFDDAFVFLEEDKNSRASYYEYISNAERSIEIKLVVYAGRIFLVADFNFGKYLAAAMMELDAGELNRLIANDSEESFDRIYLYDEAGIPVLGQVLNYQPVGTQMPVEDEATRIIQKQSSPAMRRGVRYLCSFHGVRLPWTYMKQLDPKEFRVSLQDTVFAWLPAVLIMAVFSVLLSQYIIRSIYNPIQRLLDLAAANNSGEETEEVETGRRKNEFAVLENVYSEAVSQQEHMERVMTSVAPDILENTLVKLLDGRAMEEGRLQAILDGIGNPLPLQGRFMVIACVIEEPENRMVTESEWNLYLLSLQKMLREFSRKDYRIDSVRMDREVVALLLTFPESSSVVQIRKEYHEIRRKLTGNAEVLPYRLWVEYGSIASHLKDIGLSYQECMERIQYSRYNRNIEAETVDVTESNMAEMKPSDQHAISGKDWIRGRVQETIALITQGERHGAHLLMEETLIEIEKRYSASLGDLKSAYMLFLDGMSEKAITYPLTKEEQELVEEKSVAEYVSSSEDRETLHVFILERCRQVGHLIYTYNQKNRFKYVDQAKDYIGSHYTDSALSLSDVAEHIGISSSYLSELFVELGGDKFSFYLASYRVEKARQLLQATSLPAKDVAVQCGFNSVQNFNRVFKKHTGLTPGQYRESQRGKL